MTFLFFMNNDISKKEEFNMLFKFVLLHLKI